MKSDKAGAVPGTTDSSLGGSKHPNRNHTIMGHGNSEMAPVSSSFDMGNKMTAHLRHAGGPAPKGATLTNGKGHVAGGC